MFRFPWGDMHSLNLGWFLQKFNELRADWATAEENIAGALDAEIQRAEDALSDVFDARDAAAASATAAAGSASSAGTSATAAQNSATGAASSATLANQKATAAGLSEAAAAQSATQAGNSATAAAGSATAAGQSATAAGQSATAAGQSATNAAASETAAGQSASAAAGSATAAEASAQRAEDVEESIPEDYTQLSDDVAALQTAVAVKQLTVSDPANTHREIGFISTSYNTSASRVEIEVEVEPNSETNPNIAVSGIFRGEDNLNATMIDNIDAGNIVLPDVTAGYKLYAEINAVDNCIITRTLIKNGTTLINRTAMRWFDKPKLKIYLARIYTYNSPLSTKATIKYTEGAYSSAY